MGAWGVWGRKDSNLLGLLAAALAAGGCGLGEGGETSSFSLTTAVVPADMNQDGRPDMVATGVFTDKPPPHPG